MVGFTYDENGEEIRRLFVPYDDPGRSSIPRQDLVVYNTEKQISQLMFKALALAEPNRDEHSMVIYIDGACPGNGTPDARASYGVYFGPGSQYNVRGLVQTTAPQTSTRAEIDALGHALEAIKRICDSDLKLSQIKIVSDSDYLVKAMSQYIEGLVGRGGRKSDGKRVEHFDRLKDLHQQLDDMEYGDDGE